jgi:hypothetical protein
MSAWARAGDEEGRRRQEQITAKRLATREANAERRPPAPRDFKPAAFYIPKDADLEALLGERQWEGAYLLNLVHVRRAWWREDAGGKVPLKAAYLHKVLGPRLRPVCRALVGAGYLEWDGSYDKGKCQRYGIPDKYRATHRVVCPEAALNRKIARVYADEDRALLPVHRWLAGRLEHLAVDLEKAREVIATLGPKSKRRKVRYTTAEYRRKLTDQVTLLANGDFRLTADKYGRVHSPVTRLPRELRGCLRVGGRPLVNVDLANSQPWVLGVVVVQALTGTRWARGRLARMGFTDRNPYNGTHKRLPGGRRTERYTPTTTPTTPTTTPTNTPPPPVPNPYYGYKQAITPSPDKGLGQQGSATPPADVAEWMRHCAAGTLYESLMTEGERAKGKRFRARLKVRLYRVLFGRNPARGRGRFRSVIRERFRARYPTVAKVLAELKRRNYRHSSHVLQNFEATLFIYRVCGRVMRERPDCFVATIHDSILTTPDNVGYVKGVILGELAKVAPPPPVRAES